MASTISTRDLGSRIQELSASMHHPAGGCLGIKVKQLDRRFAAC
jgi:hypothetical protein